MAEGWQAHREVHTGTGLYRGTCDSAGCEDWIAGPDTDPDVIERAIIAHAENTHGVTVPGYEPGATS